jgi:hypothetical protein
MVVNPQSQTFAATCVNLRHMGGDGAYGLGAGRALQARAGAFMPATFMPGGKADAAFAPVLSGHDEPSWALMTEPWAYDDSEDDDGDDDEDFEDDDDFDDEGDDEGEEDDDFLDDDEGDLEGDDELDDDEEDGDDEDL